jgi:hypothetical protein
MIGLDGLLRARLGLGVAPRDPADAFGPEAFGLRGVPSFEALSEGEQRAVVRAAAGALFAEAVGIEAVGVRDAARRAVAASDPALAALYATFAADEARHWASLAPWAPTNVPAGGFVSWLEEQALALPGLASLALVGAVLEAWGMRHYRRLAGVCRDPALAEILTGIAADEAAHHGAAVQQVAGGLSSSEAGALRAALAALRDAVEAGPVTVVAALAQVAGPLTEADHRALDVDGHVAERATLVRAILRQAGLGSLDPWGPA